MIANDINFTFYFISSNFFEITGKKVVTFAKVEINCNNAVRYVT